MNTRNFLKIVIYSILLSPLTNIVADTLITGEWKGTFISQNNKSYKIKYNVSYNNIDENKDLKIEMINLDLEPMPDYTYQLKDIKIKNSTLSFNIPREHDTKHCTLEKQEDKSYTGKCLSDQADNGEPSKISMSPPKE